MHVCKRSRSYQPYEAGVAAPKVAPKFRVAMSVIPSRQLSCFTIAIDRNLSVVVTF